MIRRTFLLLTLVLSAGCSTIGGWFSSDNSIPPAELKTVAQPVGVQQLWETKVGAGAKDQFIRLAPALADGRIYAASADGVVMALDALSGQRLWETNAQLHVWRPDWKTIPRAARLSSQRSTRMPAKRM